MLCFNFGFLHMNYIDFSIRKSEISFKTRIPRIIKPRIPLEFIDCKYAHIMHVHSPPPLHHAFSTSLPTHPLPPPTPPAPRPSSTVPTLTPPLLNPTPHSLLAHPPPKLLPYPHPQPILHLNPHAHPQTILHCPHPHPTLFTTPHPIHYPPWTIEL